MAEFVVDYFRRIDHGGEDAEEAALQLETLLELYFLPHANRLRTSRLLIGSRLANRGTKRCEVQGVFAACCERLKSPSTISPHVIRVLASVHDEMAIAPLLSVIPLLVERSELEMAASSALNAVCNILLAGKGLDYLSDFIDQLRVLKMRLAAGPTRELVAYLLSVVNDRMPIRATRGSFNKPVKPRSPRVRRKKCGRNRQPE